MELELNTEAQEIAELLYGNWWMTASELVSELEWCSSLSELYPAVGRLHREGYVMKAVEATTEPGLVVKRKYRLTTEAAEKMENSQ